MGRRASSPREPKTPENFDCLLLGIGGARTKPMFDNRVHQETPVACKHRAIFRDHDLKQATVVGHRFVSGIKAQKPEVARESAQMTICHKVLEAPGLEPWAQREKIRGSRKAVDLDSGRCLHLPAEIDTHAVLFS